jgi:hypothetical protein
VTILLLRIFVIFPSIYICIKALNSIIFNGKIVTAYPKLTVFLLFLSLLNIAIGYAFGRQVSDNKATADVWAALRYLSIIGNGIGVFAGALFFLSKASIVFAIATLFFAGCLTLVTLFDVAVESDQETIKAPEGMENLDHFGRSILAHSKVYSSTQIFCAALLGGIPAGCWFLSRNFKVTGKPGVAMILPWMGFTLSIFIPFITLELAPKPVVLWVLGLSMAAAFKSAARKFEGETRWALTHGAQKGGNWSLVGISFLWDLAALIAILLLAILIVTMGFDPSAKD